MLGADLHRRVGVGLEVVEPSRMRRLAGLRSHHHDGVAVFEVHHRRGPLHTAPGARVVDQDDPGLGPARKMAAKPSAGAPVESNVDFVERRPR